MNRPYQNIGDPATFMKVHNAEAEEQLTEEAMVDSLSSEEFDQKYQADESNEGDELMTLFFSGDQAPREKADSLHIAKTYSIYQNDYEFVKSCFEYLNRDQAKPVAEVSYNDAKQTLSVIAPDDLKDRFRFMPSEIWPDDGEFILTADIKSYQIECARSRNDEHAWPKQHYLWRKHPVVEWLQERMLSNTGRHEALVLLGLNRNIEPDESIFLVSALIPNRKANPVIWSWYAVHCRGEKVEKISPLRELLQFFNLGQNPLPNTARPIDIDGLSHLRKLVVSSVKEQVLKEREAFDAKTAPQLAQQLEELDKLRTKQVEQLELMLSSSKQDERIKQSRKKTRMKRVDEIFTSYQHWVEDTMQTEPAPVYTVNCRIGPGRGLSTMPITGNAATFLGINNEK